MQKAIPIIKDIRIKLGKTPEEFAEELKISLSMYEKIEYGYLKPGRKIIERLKTKYPFIDINIFFD